MARNLPDAGSLLMICYVLLSLYLSVFVLYCEILLLCCTGWSLYYVLYVLYVLSCHPACTAFWIRHYVLHNGHGFCLTDYFSLSLSFSPSLSLYCLNYIVYHCHSNTYTYYNFLCLSGMYKFRSLDICAALY